MAILKESNFSGSNGKYFKIRLDYSYSQDIGTNATTLIKSLYFISTGGAGSGAPISGYIDGEYVGSVGSISKNQTILVGTKTDTIEHENDGTKTIEYSASMSGSWTGLGSASVSGTLTLPKIDRLATITDYPSSLTDEDTTITFSYSNPADFKVKVQAMVTQESGIGFSYDEYITENPFSWNWLATTENRDRLYSVTRNGTTANLSLRLLTYNNNDEQLGITAVNIPLSIINAEPFVEIEVEEQNEKVKSIVDGELIAVNYVSQLKSIATFIGSKGATLKKISINGIVGNSSPFEVLVNVASEVPSTIFGVVASVEDSRTLTDGAEKIYQLIDYRPVKINSYKFKRENPTSDQIYLTANITYWNVIVNNVNNTPKLSYSTDGNTYVTIPASEYTIDDSSKSITLNNYAVPTKLNYKNQGTYYLKVEDNFTDDGENEIVTKGIPTTEKGEHDFQVNGDLFIADEDRQNKINVLEKINGLVIDNLDDNATDKAPSQKAVNEAIANSNKKHNINDATLLFSQNDLIYFTPVNGTGYAYYGNCYYYKVGTRVHIHLGLSGLPNGQVNIFTLPVGYRPLSAMGGAGVGDVPSHYAGWEVITNGNVSVHTAYGYMLADIEFDAFG